MHAAAERGGAAARLLPPGCDGGEGETCGERSPGGEGAAKTTVSWRGRRMRRPSSVAAATVASGFLMPRSLAPLSWSRWVSICACSSEDITELRLVDLWAPRRRRAGVSEEVQKRVGMSSKGEKGKGSLSLFLSFSFSRFSLSQTPARSSSRRDRLLYARMMREDRPRGEEAERGKEGGSIAFVSL